MAAQFRTTSVPQLLHGVPGGRPHAGPPHQEGPEGAPQNGGQLPQVQESTVIDGKQFLFSDKYKEVFKLFTVTCFDRQLQSSSEATSDVSF